MAALGSLGNLGDLVLGGQRGRRLRARRQRLCSLHDDPVCCSFGHAGVFTGVAFQVQYPGAERVMMSDLRNLKVLAWFLQKFELDFDILSSLRELSKQIKGEFDFRWAFLVRAVVRGVCLLCHYTHGWEVFFFVAAYFHQQVNISQLSLLLLLACT